MKQKLFTGFSLMALAGVSFWACGEGSINKMDETDNLMAMQYGDHDAWVSFKEEQKDACKADMNCYIQYQGYIDGTELPPEDGVSSSSEDGGTSNQQQRSSSSQGAINIDNNGPTSSATIIDPGQTTTSSSSAGTPVTGLGDCKPLTTPIDKGGQTQWQFVGNTELYKPMEFATFTYVWDFGELGTGSGFKTDAITYPASGKYTATVTVTTKDGSTETKVCKDTLQVNGDKITCTCAAAGGDITTDAGVATWTATCTSASEINKYIWDGVEGVSTTFTHTFAAKGDAYKPTLKVGNTDKTEITVETCPQVTATDASLPDYFLTATEKAKDFAAAGEYDIQIQFDCSSNMTFYCQGSGVEVSATVESVALSNQGKTKDYYIFGTLPASACSGSAFVHLVLTGGAAKCGMQ